MAVPFQALLLRGYTIGLITAYAPGQHMCLTLAELHVLVLTSYIKLVKLLQNLMKLLPNHI